MAANGTADPQGNRERAMAGGPIIWWLRRDLRLDDNTALRAAVARGGAVIPVFIWAPEEEADWPPGSAARWWLDRSLRSLSERLATVGSRLIIRRGSSRRELRRLAAETAAEAVVWNKRHEPAALYRDGAEPGSCEVALGPPTGDWPPAQ